MIDFRSLYHCFLFIRIFSLSIRSIHLGLVIKSMYKKTHPRVDEYQINSRRNFKCKADINSIDIICLTPKIITELNMCSTPRPRTKVAGKKATSTSFLSCMSTDARRRFTEQANIAQVRRDKIRSAKRNQNITNNTSTKIKNKIIKENAPKRLSYWLLTASLKEIANLLFFGSSKAN